MNRITLFLVFTMGFILCSCEKVKKEDKIISRVEWRGKQLTFTNKVVGSRNYYSSYDIDNDDLLESFEDKDKKIRLYLNVPEKKYDIKKYGGIELFVTFYNCTAKIQKYYYGKWITNENYIGPLYGLYVSLESKDYIIYKNYTLPYRFAERRALREPFSINTENNSENISYNLKYYKDGFLTLYPGEYQTYLIKYSGEYLGYYEMTNVYLKYEFCLKSDYSKYHLKYSGNKLADYLQNYNSSKQYTIYSWSEIVYINMEIPESCRFPRE